MYTTLVLVIAVGLAIIILAIISMYFNRNNRKKEEQFTAVIAPESNEILSVDDKQTSEITEIVIQPVAVNNQDTEPMVEIIRYIRTNGQDEYYKEKLLNQEWKKKVEEIKKRDGYQCKHCFGLTLLENIEEIKNYVDYPEVGEVVIDLFKNKDKFYKTSSVKYKVFSAKKIENFYITELYTHLLINVEMIDLVSISPIYEENICGMSTLEDVNLCFRYNAKEPEKTTNTIGVIYFKDGNTNDQLVLRNIDRYNKKLPYAKQGVLTFNGLSIVFPLLTIKKENLEVHHLSYYEDLEPWDYRNELITLCHSCHMKTHEQEIPVKRIVN